MGCFISTLLSPSPLPVLHTQLPRVPRPPHNSLSSYPPVATLIDLALCSTASGKAPGYIGALLKLDLLHVSDLLFGFTCSHVHALPSTSHLL